ncbi:MAG TPA: hypothetical protein VMA53_14775 [Stellaceae bacterium]|nr:hypothetical protein [Stellaceae bacterium]
MGAMVTGLLADPDDTLPREKLGMLDLKLLAKLQENGDQHQRRRHPRCRYAGEKSGQQRGGCHK